MKKLIICLIGILLVFTSCNQPLPEEIDKGFIGYTDKDFEELLIGEWVGIKDSKEYRYIFEETNLVKIGGDSKSYNYGISGSYLHINVMNSGSLIDNYYFMFEDKDTLILRDTRNNQKIEFSRL